MNHKIKTLIIDILEIPVDAIYSLGFKTQQEQAWQSQDIAFFEDYSQIFNDFGIMNQNTARERCLFLNAYNSDLSQF